MISVSERTTSVSDHVALAEYHHGAMEVRRSLELKIVTGAIVFFLLTTKAFSDANIDTSPWSVALVSLTGLYTALLMILGFLLWRIEKATRPDRECYHQLSNEAWNLVHGLPILDLDPDKSKPKTEKWGTVLLRSWAAVPPFAATCVIAIACLFFLGSSSACTLSV
jgi:hypothetical protein